MHGYSVSLHNPVLHCKNLVVCFRSLSRKKQNKNPEQTNKQMKTNCEGKQFLELWKSLLWKFKVHQYGKYPCEYFSILSSASVCGI